MRHNSQEMNDSDERHLLAGARQLDTKSLAAVYDRYSPAIYAYAMRLLGDISVAEDCVSETFSRLLKALKHGQGPVDYLKAYLYRVAHNWITDSYRRQAPTVDLDAELHADPSESPVQATAAKLEQERVRMALKNLPAEQRLVIALRFLEDRSHEEVAAILGRTVEATRALQHRAMTALRRMLIETEE